MNTFSIYLFFYDLMILFSHYLFSMNLLSTAYAKNKPRMNWYFVYQSSKRLSGLGIMAAWFLKFLNTATVLYWEVNMGASMRLTLRYNIAAMLKKFPIGSRRIYKGSMHKNFHLNQEQKVVKVTDITFSSLGGDFRKATRRKKNRPSCTLAHLFNI